MHLPGCCLVITAKHAYAISTFANNHPPCVSSVAMYGCCVAPVLGRPRRLSSRRARALPEHGLTILPLVGSNIHP
eukprot:36490-Eustigmatos_ZCMA.PRE.1